MPEAACVIRYAGKRGVVWRIKYRDASGRQVKETLGRADEGWTRRKAHQELRARLTAVEREGYRKPERVTFGSFAARWLATYPEAAGLKRSTVYGYGRVVRNHLVPALGAFNLEELDVDVLESYVAAKRRQGLSPRSVNRQLVVCSLILKAALRQRLIRENPVGLVQRPREPRRRWRILKPDEVRRVEEAFRELVDEAAGEERAWREQARVIFVVLLGTGLRRGELMGLRWRSVHLADPEGAYLRVEETYVRDAVETPKSEAGERTIALGPRLAEELFQHRRRTAYAGDDDRVFVSPTKGTAFDAARYRRTFTAALARAGIADYVRPFHDGRHSSITNAAAAGTSPAALMSRAGHSSFTTTQGYIDLAGEQFRAEADLLEQRLWGDSGTKNRYQVAFGAELEAEAGTPRR